MNSRVLRLIAVGLLAGTTAANATSLLGTWSGSLTDSNPSFGGATMDFTFDTQTATSTSGTVKWLSQTDGWVGCTTFPCFSTFSGTVSNGGMNVDVTGTGTWEYIGVLSSNGDELSGHFQGPTGPGVTPTDFGTWEVTRVIEPASLSLLGLGLAVFGFLRKRKPS